MALVFPSRYEGFGLPVVEAMACGCPVITTPLSSLPEVAGDAAIYVDPDNADALREAFDQVRDPSRRMAMIAAGATRAAHFEWAERRLGVCGDTLVRGSRGHSRSKTGARGRLETATGGTEPDAAKRSNRAVVARREARGTPSVWSRARRG